MILSASVLLVIAVLLTACQAVAVPSPDAGSELLLQEDSHDDATAAIAIEASRPAPWQVSPFLYGKFCEHLGANIYRGMDAQILRNPTFGRWPFGAGPNPDGGSQFRYDADAARGYLQHHQLGLDEHDVESIVRANDEGGALFWFAESGTEAVRFSPDVAPSGGRAQRVEFPGGDPARSGIVQRTRLPLHRTCGYQFRVAARAAQEGVLQIELLGQANDGGALPTLASASFDIGTGWMVATGRLGVPADAEVDPEGLFTVRVSSAEPANVVLASVMLLPDDHVHGADPDIVARLREARLPMLRWPGGNFASAYHWRDGVGPLEHRPTKPNLAWSGLEYHTFGTDEFLALCRTLECEPLICVNAGDGTPEEAAAWVEYCNGSPDSPMGALRAHNGHPQPYGVRCWEIGNELYGNWQFHHTTPEGYADRYERFAKVILDTDPTVRLLACGNRPNSRWNDVLLRRCADKVSCITHHCLVGGQVDENVDAQDLFHAFMAYPAGLADAYRRQLDAMRSGGIVKPTIAVTELQLFAHAANAEVRDRIPRPATIAEALYDAVFVNACIRMGGTIEILTHSATVNHGGGLRKARERVWANPAHYGHVMGRPLGGGRPVPVRVCCPFVSTKGPTAGLPAAVDMPVLDVMAVLSDQNDELWVMIVHRSAAHGDLSVRLDVNGFDAARMVEWVVLGGEAVNDANTREAPERIAPRTGTLACEDDRVTCTVPRLSLTRLCFRLATAGYGR